MEAILGFLSSWLIFASAFILHLVLPAQRFSNYRRFIALRNSTRVTYLVWTKKPTHTSSKPVHVPEGWLNPTNVGTNLSIGHKWISGSGTVQIHRTNSRPT